MLLERSQCVDVSIYNSDSIFGGNIPLLNLEVWLFIEFITEIVCQHNSTVTAEKNCIKFFSGNFTPLDF